MAKVIREMRTAALFAVILILSACGATSPTAPTSDKPVVDTAATTASLSGLSSGARVMFTVGSTVRRVPVGTVVKIYSVFSDDDTLVAANSWTPTTGVSFVKVGSSAEATIRITNELPTSVGSDACGFAAPSGNPSVIGGIVQIAFGIKAGCDGGLRSLIAHEIGHVLGFHHSPEKRDVMSPAPLWNAGPTPELDEAVRWFYYTAPIGALIVQ